MVDGFDEETRQALSFLPDYIEGLNSSVEAENVECVVSIRKLLTSMDRPPLQAIVDAGAETCSAVNCKNGIETHLVLVVNLGIVPRFSEFLRNSGNTDLQVLSFFWFFFLIFSAT